MFKKFIFTLLVLSISLSSFSQTKQAEIWTDLVMSQMTVEQRISQLLMVAAYSNKGEISHR